jgi:DNA-binding transcriptional ArsR family regulator
MARNNPIHQSLALDRDDSPPLDKILSSSGRIRILVLLSEVEELHLTEIAKRTEQSFSAAERHLDDLSKAAIVEERDYGRVRIFKLNRANNRAKLLRELILKWNHNSQELRSVQAQA